MAKAVVTAPQAKAAAASADPERGTRAVGRRRVPKASHALRLQRHEARDQERAPVYSRRVAAVDPIGPRDQGREEQQQQRAPRRAGHVRRAASIDAMGQPVDR